MQLYIALADDRDPKLLGEALTLPASETADTDGYAYSTATLTTDLSAYSKAQLRRYGIHPRTVTGMASVSTTGKMPVTMVHLNMVEGIDPVLQVAEGYTVDLPTEVDKTLLDRTDPTWPSTWFAPILTCIRSWPTGAPTTERGPTAIWGRTCSPWRA